MLFGDFSFHVLRFGSGKDQELMASMATMVIFDSTQIGSHTLDLMFASEYMGYRNWKSMNSNYALGMKLDRRSLASVSLIALGSPSK